MLWIAANLLGWSFCWLALTQRLSNLAVLGVVAGSLCVGLLQWLALRPRRIPATWVPFTAFGALLAGALVGTGFEMAFYDIDPRKAPGSNRWTWGGAAFLCLVGGLAGALTGAVQRLGLSSSALAPNWRSWPRTCGLGGAAGAAAVALAVCATVGPDVQFERARSWPEAGLAFGFIFGAVTSVWLSRRHVRA